MPALPKSVLSMSIKTASAGAPDLSRIESLAWVPLATPAPQFDLPVPGDSQVRTPFMFFQPCAASSALAFGGLYGYGPWPPFSCIADETHGLPADGSVGTPATV